MFWKFHLASSGLDTILSKEDVTLKDLLDEEDILQECKTQNAKLVEFLVKDEILSELVDLAINVPPETEDEKTQFKYANLACEVISSDIDAVIEKMATEKDLLDKIWGFLDNPPPLNPLIASFFAKIVAALLARKGSEMFEHMKEKDVANKLLLHLDVSAIMEVFIKIISIVDSAEVKLKIDEWLDEEELVQKLIGVLHPSNSHKKHCNASNLLTELVRMGRESPSCVDDSEQPKRLFLSIEKEEVLAGLLDNILSNGHDASSESALVSGMNVLLSLIEYKRPSPEGFEELFAPMNVERITKGTQSVLKALTPRLKDFHKVLVDPPKQSPMITTVGKLDPPLGKVRLHVAWLISAAVAANNDDVNSELTELGTLNVLLELFFKYQWNNFLHTYVEHCISSILSHSVTDNNEDSKHGLLTHLICDCCLVTKMLDAWEDNGIQTSNPGSRRKGYMGHLTCMANSFLTNMEKGGNSELLTSLFKDLPDEIQASWKDLVDGSLNDINKRNTAQIQISSHMLHSSSDDEDEGMFKNVSLFQYETSLQQAFSNYQVQQLSNEFIESFGQNEEDLNGMNRPKNPFDEIGNIDFSINADEQNPDAQLFEAVCNEKIHQFDDSGSDEEDIWEERELKFSPKSAMKRGTGRSNSDDSASSSENSSCSSDDEAVFSDEENQPSTVRAKCIEPKSRKETEVKMEIDQADADWAANFDNDGVAMDTLDAASVGWVDPSATSVVEVKDEAGFADFTDISKISFSDENQSQDSKGPDSPIAMDEDSNDAFKVTTEPTKVEEKTTVMDVQPEDVKMEEDVSTSKEADTKSAEFGEDNTKRGEVKEDDTVLKTEEGGKNEKEAVSPESRDSQQENSGNVKIDVVECSTKGLDPLLVTSKELGGFVVIDSTHSPTTKESATTLGKTEETSLDSKDIARKGGAASPTRGGVSVVTVSSRKVINISSDGKSDMERSRSPKRSKSPASPSSPRNSPDPQKTEFNVDKPKPNGPVETSKDAQQKEIHQEDSNKDSSNLAETVAES